MKFKLTLIASLALLAAHCGIESAEDKEFTQEEKQAVFSALCKKSDYDQEKLENGPISCHCFQQLQSAEAGFRAKIWHSDEMKEEGLRTAAQLGKLERAAQHHIPEKCEKFNDSFWRYYGKLAYADEVRREQGDKRSGSAPLLNNMSHIDVRLNAINARAVSDALEATKINVPLATAAFVVSTIVPSQEKRDE